MTADVERYNLFFSDHNGEGKPIAVGEAHCLDPFQPAGQPMELQVRLEGVYFQITQNCGELGTIRPSNQAIEFSLQNSKDGPMAASD